MMIYLDTETALIEQGLLAPPLTCVQFAMDDGPVGVAVTGVDQVESLCRTILKEEICGHNIAYDMLVLLTEYPGLQDAILKAYEDDRVTDTQIREKLLHIKAGTLTEKHSFLSLADLSKKYGISKDPNDPWRLRYSELRGVPFLEWPRAAREYARHDVDATRHVYLAQGDEIPDERRQTRHAFTLHCIGAQGVHTDPVAVERFRDEIMTSYTESEALLKSVGLVKANGVKDTKAAKALMVSVLGDDVRLTKTKQVSLDEEACLLSGNPTLMAYQTYGSHKNLLSRMEGLKLGYDKPLNSRFDSLKATGRTSCSKGQYGYPLQNMRRIPGERECFAPKPGNVFLACDYDSFELCTLAQICIWAVGSSELAKAINEGLSPHLYMASVILGEPYEALKAILADPTHPRYKGVKQARQGCKIADFGYPGGMGAQSFRGYAKQYGMDLDLDEAEELKEGWLATWPEMVEYREWISNGHLWHQVLRKSGYWDVTSVTAFLSNRVRGGVSYTEASNNYFQALAADAAKDAGWYLLKDCLDEDLEGWRIWNFVHDEYILEGPEEDGARASGVVQEIMEATAQRWVPDVNISASPCLMYRWSKDAEPIYENDLMVPWGSR